MLRGENFRRRHERDLVAIFDDDGGGFQSDDCLAAADVAFEKAVHGERAFEVRCDFDENAFLRGRGLERENALDGFADFFLANAHGDAALRVIARAAQGESELIVEKFLEDQAGLRGAAKAVEQLNIFIFGREMGEED